MNERADQASAAAIEARQRANRCNQDNEPDDWGRPCCDLCTCADEAAGRKSMRDQCREEGLPERCDLRVGDLALVQARPNYWGAVTWVSDHPGGKITVAPQPGQGITERKRTVWKDRILEFVTNG